MIYPMCLLTLLIFPLSMTLFSLVILALLSSISLCISSLLFY
jgi:hypothetical protein